MPAFADDGETRCGDCMMGNHQRAKIRATAVGVYWNEAHRIEALMRVLADRFDEVVVVVQKSTDDTLSICQRVLTGPKHHVIEDEWRGGGDFSMPLALSHVTNEFAFVISGDEMPDDELLDTMPDAIAALEAGGYSGTMIRCEEYIDGIEYVEHGMHVRLFRASGGWEARHHSAAPHVNLLPYCWPHGAYIHTRTLDEVWNDYLRKLTMMEREGETRLAQHNAQTIFNVSTLVAAHKGWAYVRSRPQWPEVERRVFSHIPNAGIEVL